MGLCFDYAQQARLPYKVANNSSLSGIEGITPPLQNPLQSISEKNIFTKSKNSTKICIPLQKKYLKGTYTTTVGYMSVL